MQSLTTLASSSDWWISVFFVGIVINLITAGLMKYFPKLLYKIGKRWQLRNEKSRVQRAQEIEIISSSTEDILIASNKIIELKLEVIYSHIQALLMLGFGNFLKENYLSFYIAVNSLSVIFMLIGLRAIITHGQFSILFADARLLRLELKPNDLKTSSSNN